MSKVCLKSIRLRELETTDLVQCHVFICRCQRLEHELMETKEELRIVSEQLQCAAAQKYHLQEKLCRFEVLHQQKYYVT